MSPSDSTQGCEARQAGNGADLAPLLSGTPAGPPRLALTCSEAAAACGLSARSWRRADDAGRVPLAARIGRRKLWSVAVLKAWLVMGCPSRESAQWVAAVERLAPQAVK